MVLTGGEGAVIMWAILMVLGMFMAIGVVVGWGITTYVTTKWLKTNIRKEDFKKYVLHYNLLSEAKELLERE